ncbi:MAG: 4a-hydroxytetrahydrobiopterin dehydratase [Caldimonas sp.]
MSNLLHARCRDDVAAMSDNEIRDHLAQLSGWHLGGDAIEKTFAFKNYLETIAFVNALAWICHTEDHHPELRVTFDRCVARFSTHSVSGISRNDFICATKADALVSFIG